MAEEINITSPDEFKAWLQANGRDEKTKTGKRLVLWYLLARRMALRVFPLVLKIDKSDQISLIQKQSLFIQALRCNITLQVLYADELATKAASEASNAVRKTAHNVDIYNGNTVPAILAAHVAGNAIYYPDIDHLKDIPLEIETFSALSADCQIATQFGLEALNDASLWISLEHFAIAENGEPITVTPPEDIIEWMDRLPLLTDILGPNAGLIDAWYQPLFAGKPPRFNDERARDFFLENTSDNFWEITDDRTGEDIMNDIAAGLGWEPDSANGFTGKASVEVVKRIISEQRDALLISLEAAKLELKPFREKVRGHNNLDESQRTEMLKILDTIISQLDELKSLLPEYQGQAISDEVADRASQWIPRFQAQGLKQLSAWCAPEHVADLALPTGLILTCGCVGAIVTAGNPVGFGAGAWVGKLIVGQAKTGEIDKQIADTFDDE